MTVYNLTLESVQIGWVENGQPYMRAFINTALDRAALLEFIDNDKTMYAEICQVWGKKSPVDGEPVVPQMGIEERRAQKIQEISAACNAAIVAGIDFGGGHYSLDTEDQINIGNLAMAAAQGETTLYHADGELCRPYPPWEMGQLATDAVGHKVYHTTYYNHLKAWVNRAADEELDAIHYGAELPADLKAHMEGLIGK